jgi:hypothetical protein
MELLPQEFGSIEAGSYAKKVFAGNENPLPANLLKHSRQLVLVYQLMIDVNPLVSAATGEITVWSL